MCEAATSLSVGLIGYEPMATVKVSKETYGKLNELAGKLRVRLHRPVSIDKVLDSATKARSQTPSDFAATFLTTDRVISGGCENQSVLTGSTSS
jgi:hypothetical protein